MAKTTAIDLCLSPAKTCNHGVSTPSVPVPFFRHLASWWQKIHPPKTLKVEGRITRLEDEYYQLIYHGPGHTSRLAEIISELGQLWNLHGQLSGRTSQLPPEDSHLPLAETLDIIVTEESQALAQTRDPRDLHLIFARGVLRMRQLIDEDTEKGCFYGQRK